MDKSSARSQFFARRSNILLVFNLVFIVIIFLLSLRPENLRRHLGLRDIAYYNNKTLTIKGFVCEEADVDYKSRRLTICVDGAVSGRVLISTHLYPVYDYGDYLEIYGKLQSPPEIDGFDYDAYLARHDVYSVMYVARLKKIPGPSLSFKQIIYKHLIKTKQLLASILNRYLPEPEAGLANAILFGYRRTVLRSDMDVFARVGLSHMIAISGSHITILSAMIINFFLFLGLSRRRALQSVFLFLFIYPLITGLSASAVRSAIMGALAFLAVYYQRLSSFIKALVFSAALMLAFNRQLLSSDIGFQLSFLAILGIIYLYPIGEEKTRYWLSKKKLRRSVFNFWKAIFDTVNLTVVSQIVILPIALINFKQLSIIAPLANILVLWTFPPLLAALIIALALAAIIPWAGTLVFFPAYGLLKYIFVLSEWLAKPSWASVSISGFNWSLGAGYYGFLIWLIYSYKRKKGSSASLRPSPKK